MRGIFEYIWKKFSFEYFSWEGFILIIVFSRKFVYKSEDILWEREDSFLIVYVRGKGR